MADESANAVATDPQQGDLTELADKVKSSIADNGPDSSKTIRLLKEYVDGYLANSKDFDPQAKDYDALVTEIQDNVGLKWSDPTLTPLIRNQIEDTAASKRCASSDTPEPSVDRGADPIEMFSGQFIHEVVDLVVDGAGLDFVFRRVYKNQAIYFGPLGANWDHNFNLHIRQVKDDLICSSGELRDDFFTRHPKYGQLDFSYWVPPDGLNAVIERSGNSFVWRSQRGVRRVYEQDPFDQFFHRLQRIEDRFGNYLAVTYQQDQIRSIEINHPARFVTFDYDAVDRIIFMRDHAGRKWSYDYDDYGDLVKVTSPPTNRYRSGLSTWYEYSSSQYSPPLQHNLLGITDPAGRMFLENEYGTGVGLRNFNRVVWQRQGNGDYWFDYETVIDEFDFDYSESEKPAFQVNQILPNGQTVHLVYNKYGNLLLREEYVYERGLDRLLQWRYRYNLDGSLVGVLTPEGCVTQYYYGRDDYLAVYGVADTEVITDANLTAARRLAFGNLLAVVRRSGHYDFLQMDLSLGVWGDFFPDVLAPPDAQDILVKYTYEPEYQQVLTVSDPRFTASADPRYPEAPLIRFEYSASPLTILQRIRYPDTTFPSPLPNGVTGLTNIYERYIQYDSRGRPEIVQDPEGSISQNIYFGGALTDPRVGYLRESIRDANLLRLTTTYDVNSVGINVGLQNARHFRTTFVVNDLGQVTERVSPGPGYKTKYFFDENGLIERIERDNLDDNGQPAPDGNEIRTYGYDELANLTREGIGGNDPTQYHVVTHKYDTSGCRIQTVFPVGNTVRFDYDERTLLKATTRGASSDLASTTRLLYDGDGRKAAQIDALGSVTRTSYDTFGRITAITDALGNLQQQVYDKLGNREISRFFEKRGDGRYYLLKRSEFSYDERGNMVRQRDALFDDPIGTADIQTSPDSEFIAARIAGLVEYAVVEFFYDRNRRLFRRVNDKGQEALWYYDGVNRETRRQDNLGNYVITSYDENANVIRIDRHELVRNSAGTVVREDVFSTLREYDALDRCESTTDALGNKSTFTYDSRDNVMSVTDPLANVRRFRYDIYNRGRFEIVQMTQSGVGSGTRLSDIVTEYVFDDNDRLSGIIDANGNATHFKHDDLNRRFLTSYADGTTVQLTYDLVDNVIARVDNNGLRTVYQVDALGRRMRLDLDTSTLNPNFPYPVGAEQYESYSYDGLGRPLVRSNDFCTITTKFDSLNRAYSENLHFATPYPMPAGTLTLARVFDTLSNRTDVIYPSGRSIHYEYDGLNRLERITSTASGSGYPGSANFGSQYEIAHYTYRGRRLDTATFGNRSSSHFAYDGAARLISTRHRAHGAPFLVIQQLFDGAGNRRLQIDSPAVLGQPNGETFKFDSLYRLTQVERVSMAAFNPALSLLPRLIRCPKLI